MRPVLDSNQIRTLQTRSFRVASVATRTVSATALAIFLSVLARGLSASAGVIPCHEGIFIVPVFRHATTGGNTESLGMMVTKDNFGTLTDLFPGDLYAEPAGTGVRDVSITRWMGAWYCVYTRDAFAQPQNRFGICKSTDLQTWTHHGDVTVADSYQTLWAPSWFLNRSAGTPGIIVSWDPLPGSGAHMPHIGTPTDNALLSWTWTAVGGLPNWFYDCRVETDGTTYYIVGVASGNPNNLRIYASTNLTAGYSLLSSPDIGGVTAEQCKLYWLGDNRWRLTYYDNPNRIFYLRTSTDGMATWSAAQQLKTMAGDAAERSFNDIIELVPNSYTVSTGANNVTLAFTRTDATEPIGSLIAEWGSDLAGWTGVPIGPASSGPDTNGVTVVITKNGVSQDSVVVTVPRSNAVGGKLFLRFKATLP